MSKSHPYAGQDARYRWSKAVADAGIVGLRNIYRKKFDIRPKDRIAAAGSCFAQHLGKRLAQSGFAYQDFEPAPPYLSDADKPKFGYGIYSGRYGNVYTARQLVQLFDRAFGHFAPAEDHWEEGGRFYDPFRPTIEEGGFASLEELRQVREGHFEAVRRLVQGTDIFVFTLGLTEAWIGSEGEVFQVCPGTVAGTFDPERHHFHNFTHSEVIRDMRKAIRFLRRANPRMKFILTVSPVPLAATMSGNHVLPATQYSKAVLRAVAGELASNDPRIDYFPSYEIITSPVARSCFYQADMRNVLTEGVDHVMSHFFGQHQPPASNENFRAPVIHEEVDLVCEEKFYDRG